MPRYQGKEFQSTLQAPNPGSLNELVESARRFASENQMGELKVLEFGPDPDGGYRAIVTAHNWNPISWLRGKLTRKKKSETEGDEEFTEVSTEAFRTPEDIKKEEEKAWRAFEKQSQREEKVEKIKREYALKRAKRLRELEDIGKEAAQEEAIQQRVKELPPEHRKAAARSLREGAGVAAQEAIEVMSEQVPEKVVSKQKVLQKEYWTKKGTDEPVPEPRTAEEKAQADYHPSQWTYIDVERKLSPPERASLARAIQFEKMELEMTKEKFKQFKRERHPAYRAAKAAGGFGQFMAGAITLGVAGTARGLRPGKGGPERATRMHAPGVPLDLYAVRPMLGVGMPSSKDLTGSELSHLRALIFPGIGRTKKQVRQVRRSVSNE